MQTVNIMRALTDMLFPRAASVARFDSIPTDVLARTAVRTVVRTHPPCLAPFPFDNIIIRDAIHAAKYHGHERAATLLGDALAPFVSEELAERRMLGTFHQVVVIPIPLHTIRMRERGFNQSLRIVEAMVASLEDERLLIDEHALVRVRSTTSQTRQTNRAERQANMRGAFMVSDAMHIAHRDVLLLDDVVTTGATLGAARDALLNAGAREVACVAVAH